VSKIPEITSKLTIANKWVIGETYALAGGWYNWLA
tara:strand:+ start:426 stop:530 length:105 start_codon:yes stop_codon:yes gene_type:complete